MLFCRPTGTYPLRKMSLVPYLFPIGQILLKQYLFDTWPTAYGPSLLSIALGAWLEENITRKLLSHSFWQPGGWFNKKMSSCKYRKSHCGDKTILQPSYLHNGISYTSNMTSFYWIRAQGTWLLLLGKTCSNHCDVTEATKHPSLFAGKRSELIKMIWWDAIL